MCIFCVCERMCMSRKVLNLPDYVFIVSFSPHIFVLYRSSLVNITSKNFKSVVLLVKNERKNNVILKSK